MTPLPQAAAAALLMVVVVVVVTLQDGVRADILDIEAEIRQVVRHHNQERRSVRDAADMRQMAWDESVASYASRIAERCRYMRPQLPDMSANLYITRGHVYGKKATHNLMKDAVMRWRLEKEYYRYGSSCTRGCHYATMIHASADRIGCGVSTCDDVEMRGARSTVGPSTLVVCLYSPKMDLRSAYQYTRGRTCSRCPRGMRCHSGLCAIPGQEIIEPSNIIDRRPTARDKDELDSNESYGLLEAHNQLREFSRPSTTNSLRNLEWDGYLERWAEYVISCEADYPGPAQTYTNFERMDQGDDIKNCVFEWSQEGGNRNLKMFHACRTPSDLVKCNHFTNLLQPELTSMACASKDCRNGTRQLVCLYDNQLNRPRAYQVRPYQPPAYDPSARNTRRQYGSSTGNTVRPYYYDTRRRGTLEAYYGSERPNEYVTARPSTRRPSESSNRTRRPDDRSSRRLDERMNRTRRPGERTSRTRRPDDRRTPRPDDRRSRRLDERTNRTPRPDDRRTRRPDDRPNQTRRPDDRLTRRPTDRRDKPDYNYYDRSTQRPYRPVTDNRSRYTPRPQDSTTQFRRPQFDNTWNRGRQTDQRRARGERRV